MQSLFVLTRWLIAIELTLALTVALAVPCQAKALQETPEKQDVAAAFDRIAEQFQGHVVEIALEFPSTKYHYKLWNPVGLKRRRLERRTTGKYSNYSGILTNRRYLVTASRTIQRATSSGAIVERAGYYLGVYEHPGFVFLLPEHISLIENRCGIDVDTFSQIIDASRGAVTRNSGNAVDGEWNLTCQSNKYGRYSFDFDMRGGQAIIRRVDVQKASGNLLYDATVKTEKRLLEIGNIVEGTYSGLTAFKFSFFDFSYSGSQLEGWNQSLIMKFEGQPIPAGAGVPGKVTIKENTPMSEGLSDLIEFESFDESQIQIVQVDGEKGVVYGIQNGKLVKLADADAVTRATEQRMGNHRSRTWWYATLFVCLILIGFFTMRNHIKARAS